MKKVKHLVAPAARPAPNRRDSAEIVEAIISAALRLGDPDLSLSALAEHAGVGLASLHRYFPTKAAVYAEVSRRLQSDFLARVRAVLESPTLSLDEAIAACCRLAVEVPGATPALRRALNLLPPSFSQENANAVFTSVVEELTRWLSSRLSAPPPDLKSRVFVAFAAGRGVVMVSRLIPELAPPDEVLIEHMVRGTRVYLQLD